MDNSSHESPRHFNQNFNSEFFNGFAALPWSELPRMSSSFKNEGPDEDRTQRCLKEFFCSVALDASFSCNSTQTILGRRHFGIRCIAADTNVSPFAPARSICCGHKFCTRDTKMFLILFRNILCPQQMFPSLRSPLVVRLCLTCSSWCELYETCLVCKLSLIQ